MPRKTTATTTARRRSTARDEVTPVRNTAIPKAAPAKVVTQDAIARRAYELWQAGVPGDQLSHWLQAERELRGG